MQFYFSGCIFLGERESLAQSGPGCNDIYHNRPGFKGNISPGNPLLKEGLSTVDLLVITSLDQLLLKLKKLFSFLQNKLP